MQSYRLCKECGVLYKNHEIVSVEWCFPCYFKKNFSSKNEKIDDSSTMENNQLKISEDYDTTFKWIPNDENKVSLKYISQNNIYELFDISV